MAKLMSDPSMWAQTDAFDDILKPPKISRSSAAPSSSKRHIGDDEMYCAHCNRQVSRLIFVNACTYECALALALTARYRYDYVYTAIMSQLCRGDLAMPRPAPAFYSDATTTEEYWARATTELYSDVPAMLDFLRERLQENGAHGAVAEKKQRC